MLNFRLYCLIIAGLNATHTTRYIIKPMQYIKFSISSFALFYNIYSYTYCKLLNIEQNYPKSFFFATSVLVFYMYYLFYNILSEKIESLYISNELNEIVMKYGEAMPKMLHCKENDEIEFNGNTFIVKREGSENWHKYYAISKNPNGQIKTIFYDDDDSCVLCELIVFVARYRALHISAPIIIRILKLRKNDEIIFGGRKFIVKDEGDQDWHKYFFVSDDLFRQTRTIIYYENPELSYPCKVIVFHKKNNARNVKPPLLITKLFAH